MAGTVVPLREREPAACRGSSHQHAGPMTWDYVRMLRHRQLHATARPDLPPADQGLNSYGRTHCELKRTSIHSSHCGLDFVTLVQVRFQNISYRIQHTVRDVGPCPFGHVLARGHDLNTNLETRVCGTTAVFHKQALSHSCKPVSKSVRFQAVHNQFYGASCR
jgi:hypothetical protein